MRTFIPLKISLRPHIGNCRSAFLVGLGALIFIILILSSPAYPQAKDWLPDQLKAASDPQLRKISGHILRALTKIRESGVAVGSGQWEDLRNQLSNPITQLDNRGCFHVCVYAKGILDSLIRTINGSGGTVETVNRSWSRLVAWIPFGEIEKLAMIDLVNFIVDVGTPYIYTGDVTTAGDAILHASEARSNFTVTGAGVKVGVISAGTDHWTNVVPSNNLPSSIEIINSRYSGDEGTAMMEIVHDLSPGSPIAFADAGLSTDDMAINIELLRNSGAKIIVDDIGWPTEPVFEDGACAQQVDSAVSAGVVYVSAAGNNGFETWQGQFTDSNEDGWHEFSGIDNQNGIALTSYSDAFQVTLQWANRWGQASDDYDVFLCDQLGNIIASGTDGQLGAGIPFEWFYYLNDTRPLRTTVYIKIRQYSGLPCELQLRVWPGSAIGPLQYGTDYSISGHQAANSCIAVGANSALTPDVIEPYSSHGPTRIYTFDAEGRPLSFIDRASLSNVGIDYVETKVGQLQFFPNPFGGTSAAAPHVAAIAALALSLNPQLTPQEVRSILESTADKVPGMGGQNYTNVYGFGRINAVAALALVVSNLANQNWSTTSSATAANSQRKLYRETSGTLHEVFHSGGEIFYRRSTDDGNTWHLTKRLSNGLAGNSLPCLSFAGATALCVWSRPGDDDRLDLECARSTDGGITWPAALTIESGFHGSDPGPIPSVSLYSDGSGIVLYRTAGSLRYKLTSNFGASWGSTTNVPSSTASCNMPSSAINTTYWNAKQANIAYATDLPENSPRIHYNYFDFQASSWGSAMDLCSVLPANYVHHANPSLAVSASEAYKTVHVAWDAEDTQLSGTRVLIHREGGFRSFPGVYSVLYYQGESKPSITGVNAETAWMVYQNATGTSVWKRYYDGTYWAGGYGTWVANGKNPQISVGSSTAKYVWTEGSQSPYEIKVSTEGLSKAGDMLAYSRALNVIDAASGGSLSLEIGTPVLVYGDGRREEIPFAESLVDSTLADIAGLLKMGQSSPFAVPSDAESLSVPIRISGIGQGTLLSDATGHITLNAVGSTTGLVLKVLTDAVVTESALRSEATLSVLVKDLADAAGNSLVQIRPEISGIRTGAGTIVSLGHMYRNGGGAAVAKGGEIAEKQSEIPTRFLLHQNYPNPFNPSTRFSFDIAKGGHVSLTIHDVLGREVAKVLDGHREPGRYTVEWSAGSGGTTVSSGVYLARLQVKGGMGRLLYSQTAKIVVVK